MKQYVEKIDVDISAQTAWQALQNMHHWLPLLSTNQKIEYQKDDYFFRRSKIYHYHHRRYCHALPNKTYQPRKLFSRTIC